MSYLRGRANSRRGEMSLSRFAGGGERRDPGGENSRPLFSAAGDLGLGARGASS